VLFPAPSRRWFPTCGGNLGSVTSSRAAMVLVEKNHQDDRHALLDRLSVGHAGWFKARAVIALPADPGSGLSRAARCAQVTGLAAWSTNKSGQPDVVTQATPVPGWAEKLSSGPTTVYTSAGRRAGGWSLFPL